MFGGQIPEEDGVAISIDHSDIVIEKSFLLGGMALRGGGIFIKNSKLSMRDVTMKNNSATIIGGSVSCISSDILVSESKFSFNLAYLGGSIGLDNCSLTANTTSIMESTASYQGGGLYAIQSSSIRLESVIMSRCRVEMSPTGLTDASQGGGLYVSNSLKIELINTEIFESFASIGSALKIVESQITISSSLIHHCSGSSALIEVLGAGTVLTMTDTQMFSNKCVFESL